MLFLLIVILLHLPLPDLSLIYLKFKIMKIRCIVGLQRPGRSYHSQYRPPSLMEHIHVQRSYTFWASAKKCPYS